MEFPWRSPHRPGEMMYNITAAGLVVATLATSMLYLRRGAVPENVEERTGQWIWNMGTEAMKYIIYMYIHLFIYLFIYLHVYI